MAGTVTPDPDAFLDHVQERSRADMLALAASDVEGVVTPVYDLNVAATLLNLGHGRDMILKVLGYVPDGIRSRLEAEEVAMKVGYHASVENLAR